MRFWIVSAVLFATMFSTEVNAIESDSQSLSDYVLTRKKEFDQIPAERRELLERLTQYISNRLHNNKSVRLTFICTHNSRRSHMSQIWASIAANEYGIQGMETYSGGTEATAFNPRAISALQRAGIQIKKTSDEPNPVYYVRVSIHGDDTSLQCFSKKYTEEPNPQSEFGAVMTCTQADQGCPLVRGADFRIAIPYEDPKVADGTSVESKRYDERCAQIAREMLFVFSKVK